MSSNEDPSARRDQEEKGTEEVEVGLDLMEWLRKMNKIIKISADCAFERTLRFPSAGSSHQRFFSFST